MSTATRQIIEAFRLQAGWCAQMNSPLYADLLELSTDNIAQGGPVDEVVGGYEGDPVEAALALRFLGGVHRLVLMGLAPELAAHYPSVGGTPDSSRIDEDFLETVALHRGYLTDALAIAPQTNAVGRSALLLPGLFEALDGDNREVRLLEIGSSGGLNLLLDKFRYQLGEWEWGDPDSPVRIEAELEGKPPHQPALRVIDRRGCDVHPLDATSEEHQLRLQSFVWPDHERRFARTRGAIEIAQTMQPIVDEEDCGIWLGQQLETRTSRGVLTVVQHSVMWQYLPEQTKKASLDALSEAGARATKARPLAHVAFEPVSGVGSGFTVTVTRWPGGEARTVASGQAHGEWVRWA
ncbi:MAG: DUF2332 domain-containing protein [Acidimicrobiia bacterium]